MTAAEPDPIPDPIPDWQVQQRPPLLTRRFEFGSYAETRVWLDALALWSERSGVYPDLNFGRNYVNVTLTPRGASLTPDDLRLAAQVSDLAGSSATGE
jgi:pterin-4a-carbinolamine dehydratase